MISKSQIKLITGLQQKKYRDKNGLFIAEGRKVIDELFRAGIKRQLFFSTDPGDHEAPDCEFISEIELKKISSLKTPNKCLAVFEIPSQREIETSGLTVALDAVRDPGNLGTIIRLCDWFGVSQLVCSTDTVDCFSPKVVQATMGSIARVAIHYVDLSEFLLNSEWPAFAACMDGDNVYSKALPESGVLVMGNESHGISQDILKHCSDRITIPQFGQQQDTESLNVATATAILLSEFRRSTGR